MDRLNVISNQLTHTNSIKVEKTKAFKEDENDVVIVSALRTPICKSKRGNLKVHTQLFFNISDAVIIYQHSKYKYVALQNYKVRIADTARHTV